MTVSVRTALVLRDTVSRLFKPSVMAVNIATADTDAGPLRRVATFVLPFSMTIDPSADYATSATSTVRSNVLTAYVSGGRGPYTYAWTILSYTAATPPSLSSTSLASIYAVQTGVPTNGIRRATLQCVATDFYGSSATATVIVDFEHTSFS